MLMSTTYSVVMKDLPLNFFNVIIKKPKQFKQLSLVLGLTNS